MLLPPTGRYSGEPSSPHVNITIDVLNAGVCPASWCVLLRPQTPKLNQGVGDGGKNEEEKDDEINLSD